MKKLHILIILTIPLFIGCSEEFLDRPPLDQIGNENYWKSAIDLQNYTAQFYQDLPVHENNALTAIQEVSADNLTNSSVNALLNSETSIATGTWQSDFAPVRGINVFFDNYTNCEDPFDSWKQFLGEAQFFKAWIYFDLVRKYGDVPWYTHALSPDDKEELMRPRDPRTLVVDSILMLLNQAFENVELRNDAPWNNNSINKEAVLAFKCRVALYEGTWQKYHIGTPFGTTGADPNKYFLASVSAAEELINGDYHVGIYSTGDPDFDYYNFFGIGNMGSINEVLLYRAYNVGEFIGHNQNFHGTTNPNETGATWSYVTSHLGLNGEPFDYLGLAETAKGNDFLIALSNNCDPRLKQSIWIPGQVMSTQSGQTFDYPGLFAGSTQTCPTGFQIKKHTNPNLTLTYANANDAGRIIFRYAEVLLNYAEAKYELDGTVAYDQLNLLRSRVGMPDFTVNPQSLDPNPIDYGYAISDELYEIRRERRVELAFETFRELDWKRWAAHALFKSRRHKGYPFNPVEFPASTPLLDGNGLIDIFQMALPDGYQFDESRDYLSSVPETEITLNPNLSQNPGWAD